MERRRNQRRVKHVPVRYWRLGDGTQHSGYSTDISPTGMFITTNTPLTSGERLRVEITDQRQAYQIEAVVARSAKVAPHLVNYRKSGMGVRFLPVDEILAKVLFAAQRPEAVAEAVAEAPPVNGVFPVRFTTAEQLVAAFNRDIATGGMFVATQYPARLDSRITVEVHLPFDGPGEPPPPLLFPARVVHRIEPQEGPSGGPPRVAGMGVELTDRTAAIAQLAPIVQILSRRSE